VRRQERAEARLLREKQKADQAADQAVRQAARRTAKRLQQTLKLSQKGRRRRVKATVKATTRKAVVVERRGGGEPLGAAAGAPPVQSRRGRKINLPAKYK
jgi:hypothetical protein